MSKYYITYSFYANCPTCDGNSADDKELCYLSSTLETLTDIINFIAEEIGERKCLKLYEMEEYGEIKLISDIYDHCAGHHVKSTSFKYEGNDYKVFSETHIESSDPTFNILYGKNS